jgi:methylated-DNA-[protein]-cysteine S-methyltransferase
MQLRLERWASPISSLLLVMDEEDNLRALEFADHESRMRRLMRHYYGARELKEGATPVSIKRALIGYFDGDTDALTQVEVGMGGTPFQREVWNALRAIPAGTTISYGELAANVGRVGACRAVGAANGANPVAIVVPCHRVIGANGTLTGYASGLPHKKWLLDHESRYAQIPARV